MAGAGSLYGPSMPWLIKVRAARQRGCGAVRGWVRLDTGSRVLSAGFSTKYSFFLHNVFFIFAMGAVIIILDRRFPEYNFASHKRKGWGVLL